MRTYSSNSNRLLSVGLYLLILAAFGLYTWVVVEDARVSRIATATERNRATAQLTARFIDSKWHDVIGSVRLLARHELLARGSGSSSSVPEIRKRLAAARQTLPDLLTATLYSPDGSVLADNGVSENLADVTRTQWYKAVAGSQSIFASIENSSTSARTDLVGSPTVDGDMIVALRLDEQNPRSGFLVVTMRPDSMTGWMRQFSGNESAIYIVDSDGQLIAASAGAPPFVSGPAAMPIEAALQGNAGGRLVSSEAGRARAVMGYAPAAAPHWAVLSLQSEAAIVGPAYNLAARFAVVIVPMLLVISGIIGLLNGMYARQERVTQHLEERNAILHATDQVRSDFLANVSHDLRTPLTTMSIALSGLLETEEAWDRDAARSSIQFVSEEIDLLEARVRNLLEMSRLEATTQNPRKVPTDLTDVVGAAMERLEPMLSARELHLRFPEEPLLASCDPTQIETVLINLIENAVKYSTPGTPLSMSGEAREGHILFTIEDSGSGIEAGQEERIFEKFYRADNRSNAQGTGLGLAICKAIVEANGGVIGVVNRPEGGSRFWFTLPCA